MALLLTDIVMPHMKGRELADRFRRLHFEIQVLCMSGYTDNVIVCHGMLEQRMNCISKPLTRESLAQSVRDAVDSNG